MLAPLLGLHAADGADLGRAAALAHRLALPRLPVAPASGLYLVLDSQGLALHRAQPGARPVSIRPDFTHGRQRYRLTKASPRGELVARACGLRGGRRPWVLDATAGFGRDGFVLARLGCAVTLVERCPILVALLEDALVRARAVDATAPSVARIELLNEDAVTVLARLTGHCRPEVIYLDPMFTASQRRGQVKKEMQLLQELLGPPDGTTALLEAALASARRRVVVKRHRQADALTQRRPQQVMYGRSTRFDVYRSEALQSDIT